MTTLAHSTNTKEIWRKVFFVLPKDIKKIQNFIADPFLRAKILADIFRINALYMIRYAGSGHVGSTFSCMDLVTWLWTEEMKNPNEKNAEPSDILFSSKGHDVPAFYSLLIGLGKLPLEKLHTLRKLNGLPGHPDVHIPYIVTNTGSLGMGISKARGMAWAKKLQGKSGRVFILLGDGELQEGQIWESLQPTANQKLSEITVIVDHNKIQSDLKLVDTNSVGDLEKKFSAFGWEVRRCDGHDVTKISETLSDLKHITDKPKVLIADTLKGAGVSFMTEFAEDGFYKFHSGAPKYEQYLSAFEELRDRVNGYLKKSGLDSLSFEVREIPASPDNQNVQRLLPAYGDELVKIAEEHKNLVAMDADLVLDTGLIPFKKQFPSRYFECGIAEQDMVSFAGGLALKGLLPIVHSFSCFLSTRSNEQIYNNATEKNKIIYVASLAGLLPATPGHSHQSVRDIATVGNIPGLVLLEPANETEARLAIRWAIEKNVESSYIRLANLPLKLPFDLPSNYQLEIGRGVFLLDGDDLAIISYGPVMLSEAVKAAKLLKEKGVSVAVINLPWLNRIDHDWFLEKIGHFRMLVTLDDHYASMGQGSFIASELAKNSGADPRQKMVMFGLQKIPACGRADEVLQFHGLDSKSLAKVIYTNYHDIS